MIHLIDETGAEHTQMTSDCELLSGTMIHEDSGES